MEGTVARIVQDRGFGFIKPAEGADLFFHAKSLTNVNFDDLVEGSVVDFDVEDDPDPEKKRKRAINVEVRS